MDQDRNDHAGMCDEAVNAANQALGAAKVCLDAGEVAAAEKRIVDAETFAQIALRVAHDAKAAAEKLPDADRFGAAAKADGLATQATRAVQAVKAAREAVDLAKAATEPARIDGNADAATLVGMPSQGPSSLDLVRAVRQEIRLPGLALPSQFCPRIFCSPRAQAARTLGLCFHFTSNMLHEGTCIYSREKSAVVATASQRSRCGTRRRGARLRAKSCWGRLPRHLWPT